MISLFSFDISILGLFVCIIAIVLGGFLGFGAALLMVPILSNILTPTFALVITYLVELPTALLLMPQALKKGNVKILLPMIIAMLLTIPIGLYFVIYLYPETIKIVISIMVILMVILLATRWRPKEEINSLIMFLGGGVLVL